MKLEKKYNKKQILILGVGKTGKSIIKFLKSFDTEIFIWDDNKKVRLIKKKLSL